jgi:hypothetical protein
MVVQNVYFCDMDETVDHLFVSYPFINSIWQWIAQFNSFTFTSSTIQDLWHLDSCIPLKNKYVIEMIRGAVLWNVWLERNRLCFTNYKSRTVSMLAMQIISMAHHWCQKKRQS